MPLFWVHSKKKENVADEDMRAVRDDHLRWQFEGEAGGKLFGAGPLFEPDGDPPPKEGMYVIVCKDAAEARAHADSDPFHAKGLREYNLLRWRINESSYIGVGLRAKLNGDEPSNPHYWPPSE